ncbi:MAG TPA: DoxX family protein [Polyangiaceae bacterium]|nr:DoxX family protein [Polyangiaceae bacterium]
MQWLARFEAPVYAALRIIAGGMFSQHGMQKILGFLSSAPPPAPGSQLWFGGLIELFGGALVALGLFTRPAAFLTSGMMAVAYFQFHWKLQLEAFKWLPLVNKGELAVLYCFVFLLIATHGPGRASLDPRFGRS